MSEGDGVSPELRFDDEVEHGLHRATQCPAARLMVVVAPPETAGVAAGDVLRRRCLRAGVVAAILCTGRPTSACVRPLGTRGVRRTRAARQTHAQATGASLAAAASHGSNGGGIYGGSRRAGVVGDGREAHQEAHGGRWELRSGRRRRIATATIAGADGETARLRGVQGVPAQFLRRSDVIDDGEASGQDGGAGRAHWPRELTAMATVLRGSFAPSGNGAEEWENGGGRVQGGR